MAIEVPRAGTPVISCLQLDENHDLIWNSVLTDIDAVGQILQTRLLLFQGEWWADVNDGLPLFQSLLGASNPKTAQAAIASLIAQRINGTPFVTGIASSEATFDPNKRTFQFNCVVNTEFGQQLSVNFTPANMAVLPIV